MLVKVINIIIFQSKSLLLCAECSVVIAVSIRIWIAYVDCRLFDVWMYSLNLDS